MTETEDTEQRRYLNRELSWLDFNSRVLAQAEDRRLPLLERLKFCAIYASNLDEFFMVRVAGLKDQVAGGVTSAPPDGLSPLGQLAEIRTQVDAQATRLQRVEVYDLLPALAETGVSLLDWDQLGLSDRKRATGEFENRIFPILTPLAVDPGHPFPYISSLSLNVAVLVVDPETGQHRFARIKVPPSLPRFLALPDNRFVAVEQVIVAHLDQMFPGMQVVGGWPFRVTRNADLALDDEDADDLLEAVELELRRRRFGRAIRLEIGTDMPDEVRDLLKGELDLEAEEVFDYRGLLDASAYWELQSIDRNDLKAPLTPGVTPKWLAGLETSRDLFARLSQGDVLLHHPYESFSSSVSEFVRLAAIDPHVLAIKITLYRTSGDSPIVDSLIKAAERGKQVAVLIELKARFDEAANIAWARRLEDAGVHVAYGLVGLKVHTKTLLIVRSEPDGVRRYCHVGTGNYNPRTARLYTDLGLFTANERIGNDLAQMFNSLTGYGRDLEFDRLVTAPHMLRSRVEELIEREMKRGTDGHIIMKMNSLVDADMIDHLYAASQAGVTIELIVRGICCLRPGVPGLSENITVRSIVGRFLEHSRVMVFANGEGKGQSHYLLGSADMMPRNLDRRVEAMVPIEDPYLKAQIDDTLGVELMDAHLAWSLDSEGKWRRVGNDPSTNSQAALVEMAIAGAVP